GFELGGAAEMLFSFVALFRVADDPSAQFAGDVTSLMMHVLVPRVSLNRKDHPKIEMIIGLRRIKPDRLAEQMGCGVQLAALEPRSPLAIEMQRLLILVRALLKPRSLVRRENSGWARQGTGGTGRRNEP